ncbi:MAG: hypothetical protein K2X27_00945 [Candidatus Obscuribacterales bacterium]|nr:hypothetical protein [Candidatus Obscuribacterales bacterium]
MNNQMEARSFKTVENRQTAILGLDYKTASILCYVPVLLVSIIYPIIILKTESKDNKELRFHAIQALSLSLAAIAFGVINSTVMGLLFPIMGFFAFRMMGFGSSLISLAFLGLSGYCIYQLCIGKLFRIPLLADFADKKA